MNNDGIKKQEIMDILKVKEYWLNKEEQKIIKDYRKMKVKDLIKQLQTVREYEY